MNIWLIHGFNDRYNGRDNVDRLEPYLAQIGSIRNFDYGWKGLIGVLFGNAQRAKELSDDIFKGDIGVGHSNGCAILHRAAVDGAPFSGLVYINPALDEKIELPHQIEWLLVYYAPDDFPVFLASLVPFTLWGGMGRFGYSGPSDDRVKNINLQSFIGPPIGHSGAFRYPDRTSMMILNHIRDINPNAF